MDRYDKLIIEPFYGGSHRQLVDLLIKEIGGCKLYTSSAKKWHWKARTSALYFSHIIPDSQDYRVLFASCVLNLAELVALRPDIGKLKKIVYFHENQLVYPVRKQQERDFQYGYNQILTCLTADVVIFNSSYNLESFLTSINSFLKLIPGVQIRGIPEKVRPKCQVLYFPLNFPDTFSKYSNISRDESPTLCFPESHDKEINTSSEKTYRDPANEQNSKNSEQLSGNPEILKNQKILHILWAHRWEHDKNPEELFEVLYRLKNDGLPFSLSVLGEQYDEVPEIFIQAKDVLKDNILHWGYLDNKDDYYDVLRRADVSVSTALHEFYGVAMLESVYFECYPLCPNRLVYPEIFPASCLYNTTNQLYKKLKEMCKHPEYIKIPEMNLKKFTWSTLKEQYISLLNCG